MTTVAKKPAKKTAIALTPAQPASKFIYTVEDRYGNEYVSNKFSSRAECEKELVDDLSACSVGNLDFDEDDLEYLTIEIIEVTNATLLHAEKAGVRVVPVK